MGLLAELLGDHLVEVISQQALLLHLDVLLVDVSAVPEVEVELLVLLSLEIVVIRLYDIHLPQHVFGVLAEGQFLHALLTH